MELPRRSRLRQLLLGLRWLAVLAPGYIHPDEFFQGCATSTRGLLPRPAVCPAAHPLERADRVRTAGGRACRPEPMSRDLLGLQATIPWEFAEKPPCRSVLSALLTSGVPLLGVRLLQTLLGGPMMPAPPPRWLGAAVLLAPRLWMVALSYALDLAVVRVCDAFGLRSSAEPALLLLGSAWPCLLLLSRPFSNSLESVLLAVALVVSVGRSELTPGARWRWFGLVSAAGVFTRFTYVVFGAVLSGAMVLNTLGPALLWRTLRSAGRATSSHEALLVRTLALDICRGAAVFLAASTTIVVVDSLYFGTVTLTHTSSNPDAAVAMAPLALLRHLMLGDAGQSESVGYVARLRGVGVAPGSHLTLTPLNSYRYNSVVENLAQHGLHPRWTHAVVNTPMMFGPLALLGLLEVCRFIRQNLSPQDSTGPGAAKKATAIAVVLNLRVVLGAIVVLYLAGLSTAPHQEARFLLPLLLPMAIMYGAQIFGSGGSGNDAVASIDGDASASASKRGSIARRGASPSPAAPYQRHQLVGLLQVAWVVFNLAVCVFFGGLHQAGVSRALISIAAAGGANSGSSGSGSWAKGSSVVFFHTYMPPVALIAQPAADNATTAAAAAAAVDVIDLKGSPISALDKVLLELLSEKPSGGYEFVVSTRAIQTVCVCSDRLLVFTGCAGQHGPR